MRLDLERDCQAVADRDHARVLAGTGDDAVAAHGQRPEQRAGALVRAVLAPHDAEDRELQLVRVAAQAVAEAESLASERDLVLNELAERRRFEDAQAALLADVETALNRRDAEIAAASREASEVREMLELRVAEIADLETRLQAEAAERARVEARCQLLESDNAALAEAADALEAIKAMIGPQR